MTEPPMSEGKKKKKHRKEQREREWATHFEDGRREKEGREQGKKRRRAERAVSAFPEDVVRNTPEKKQKTEKDPSTLEKALFASPKVKAKHPFHRAPMRDSESGKAKDTRIDSRD